MAEFYRKTRGIVVLYRCMLKPAGEFALSEFYVTRIADRQSNIMGWAFHNWGSKIDRREEAREAQRGVWMRYN